MDNQPTENRFRFRRLVRFRLRSLLIVMAFVATYTAGWVSHREWNREWHRRNLVEAISRAMKAADAPVQVESLEGTDVFVTRGRKEDVEKVMSIIEVVEDAARQ